MPPPPVIKQVTQLKGLAVFHDYTPAPNLPQFRRYNLIYGFNGCGKTTLSRVFRSLEAGALQPELPVGGEFSIELTDGQAISQAAGLDLLKDRLLVFNVDFIERCLRWNEGTADPVFYIGKAQAELAEKLEAAETELLALDGQLVVATRTLAGADREFADHKRDAARTTAEALGLGRRYTAPNLAEDYISTTYGQDLILTEDERSKLRQILGQDAPLPKLDQITSRPLVLTQNLGDARKLLRTTLGTITIEEIKKHDSMLNWVKEGFDYHTTHDLKSCLFCGNDLTSARLDALKGVVDDQFDKLTKAIASSLAALDSTARELLGVKESIPSRNDIAKDTQDEFDRAASEVRRLLERGTSYIKSVVAALSSKAETPNTPVGDGNMPSDELASQWQQEIAAALGMLNAALLKHNRSHDDFAQSQNAARTKLKQHFLADGQQAYTDKHKLFRDSQTALNKVNLDRDAKAADVETLKRQVRQHGPAADVINKLVACYLGHSHLEVQPLDVGYQITRKTVRVQGSLSEGEKTAIALCYFLSMLEAENRKLKDLIVVVDDPVSSLDTRALNYVFNLIKATLSEAAQLIILTHNLAFMNETKKWLRDRAKPKDTAKTPTATLYLLDAPCDAVTKDRSAVLVELPKLIREYESEYHYLFSKVREFSAAGSAFEGHFYVMPNILRKVLEIFLAFKLPGGSGLQSKVENIASGNYGIDPQRLRAIDRLVQLESHADSLDDLVAFSALTIEETRDAAEALLVVMQAVDKAHYDQILGLCS